MERGADTGTRTRDPRITNALLYQLSHIGKNYTTSFAIAYAKVNDFIRTTKYYRVFLPIPLPYAIYQPILSITL